ncbi:LysR family transcriptional regulator [Marinicella meishanensis]|uniref:LysR family transcriptional regulator n=1 Tax=Marinicella meishanensis TaxID=2873263 RepID=UPI001CBFA287|nr:LysR family transcriptional regulator [Marinicella sp. NBU2979]
MATLEDMLAFVRVVEAGSITQAAEQLNTVKSAISQRLSRLEAHLGSQLIKRTTRSQTLTDSGRLYYQSCVRILEEINEAEARIKDQDRALAGRIKLAVPLSFGLNHLTEPLRAFNQQHPEVVLDLDFNDRQVDLVNEGFDLAIRIARLADSTLMAKRLSYTRLVLCASPAYLARHGTPQHPNDLKTGHHKLKYVTAPELWHFKGAGNQPLKIKVPNVMTCNNGDFMRDAAIDGMGLVMIPDFVCFEAINQGQLVCLLTDFWLDNTLNIYAVYPQNRHLTQRVKRLIDACKTHFGDEPCWAIKH